MVKTIIGRLDKCVCGCQKRRHIWYDADTSYEKERLGYCANCGKCKKYRFSEAIGAAAQQPASIKEK